MTKDEFDKETKKAAEYRHWGYEEAIINRDFFCEGADWAYSYALKTMIPMSEAEKLISSVKSWQKERPFHDCDFGEPQCFACGVDEALKEFIGKYGEKK